MRKTSVSLVESVGNRVATGAPARIRVFGASRQGLEEPRGQKPLPLVLALVARGLGARLDDDGVSGLVDANPGDVVVSIGNRGAFAVLDRHSDRVLLYVQGTFSRQHSVKHLRGSEFIMFDNLGVWKSSDGTPMAYSRVLVVDAATGREKTVFPTEPRRFGPWKQYDHGRVSVSSDGLRALASYSRHAKAVEVRIEDGAVLAEFEALHDVRALPVFAGGNGVVRFLDSGGFLYAGGQARAGDAAGRQGR